MRRNECVSKEEEEGDWECGEGEGGGAGIGMIGRREEGGGRSVHVELMLAPL